MLNIIIINLIFQGHLIFYLSNTQLICEGYHIICWFNICSAYSVFNEDFRELPGTLNADRLDRDIRAGQFWAFHTICGHPNVLRPYCNDVYQQNCTEVLNSSWQIANLSLSWKFLIFPKYLLINHLQQFTYKKIPTSSSNENLSVVLYKDECLRWMWPCAWLV